MNIKPISTTSLRSRRAVTPLVAMALCVAWTQRSEASDCCHCCDINLETDSETISSDRSVDCINVESGFTLTINAGVTLTITGPGPSCVDHEVILEGSGSTLAFTTNDHEVTGSGKIKGQNDAIIEIASGVTFTSDVKITGRLKIQGTGNFTNEGSVTADDGSGALDIMVTGTIDDSATANWKVKKSGASLIFREEPASLQGDFTVSDGTLQAGDDLAPGDDIDVVTTGHLTQTGGKIIAGVNDSFVFNSP